MAAKELMTWVPGRKRWMKFYCGKMYAVSCKQLKVPGNKEDSRSAANAWWLAKQKEIDEKSRKPNQDKYEDVIRTRQRMAAWFKKYLRQDPVHQKGLDEQEAHIKRLKHILETEDEPPKLAHLDDPFFGMTQGGRQTWWDRFHQMDFEHEAVPDDRTAGFWGDKWLDGKRNLARAGEIAPDRFRCYKYAMDCFLNWCDRGRAIDDLTSNLMEDWHGWLLGEIAKKKEGKGGMSRSYAKERLDVSKQLVTWLSDHDLIPLPKNVANPKRLRIKLDRSSRGVVVIDPEKVKELLVNEDLPERCRLWLHLMANCGMYQVDIARLRRDQVDLKAGRITRKRSKTESHENVPKVSYKLWKRTTALLAKYMEPEGELAFLNEDDKPLQQKFIDGDGKAQMICNITSSYGKLRRKLKLKIPLGQLRKSSANLIFNHDTYRPLHSLFLGHAPRSVAEQHYVSAGHQMLDKAVKWLGVKYGVE